MVGKEQPKGVHQRSFWKENVMGSRLEGEPPPTGATHVSIAYNTVNWYKYAIYGYGVESNDPFWGWFWWNGKKWVYDGGVNSDRFERIVT